MTAKTHGPYVLIKAIREKLGQAAVRSFADEMREMALKLRGAKRQGRDADYEKYQDQAYGYTQALAQLLQISWFKVTDEVHAIWNAKIVADALSREHDKAYQAGLKQRHYARRHVALKVKHDILKDHDIVYVLPTTDDCDAA